MNCEECLSVVEEYFDGELDGSTGETVAQHLDTCATCARAYRSLERESQLFLQYECDASASHGFWDKVMEQAATPSAPVHDRGRVPAGLGGAFGALKSWRIGPALAALIVLVAIGITVAVMQYTRPREGAALSSGGSHNAAAPQPPGIANDNAQPLTKTAPVTDDISGAPTAKPQLATSGEDNRDRTAVTVRTRNAATANRRVLISDRTPTPEDLVREAEQKYVAAISMLSRDVSRRRSRLDEATVLRFEQTLTAVDRTIAETRREVRRHPGDPLAAKYMLAAYSRKVDVLRSMIGY